MTSRTRSLVFIAMPVAVVALVAIVFGARIFEDRELSRGRELLMQKKYAPASKEIVKALEKHPFDLEARGLFLFAGVMEKYPQNPIEDMTGFNAEKLAEVVAANKFASGAGKQWNDPGYAAFAKSASSDAKIVRGRLAIAGAPTRNWNDAEAILEEFSNAAVKYIDTELVQKNDPEREILDFAAVIEANRGNGHAMDYIIDRLEEANEPLASARLVYHKDFMALLKTKASDKAELSWNNAVDIIARRNLHTEIGKLSRKFGAVNSPPQSIAQLLNALFNKYGIFRYEEKPYAELGLTHFDPARLHWREIPVPDRLGRTSPVRRFAWVYGYDERSGKFASYFLHFSSGLKWVPMKFSGKGEPDVTAYYTSPWPVAGAVVCGSGRELALNIARIESAPGGELRFAETWIPYRMSLSSDFIGKKGKPRASACLREKKPAPDVSEKEPGKPKAKTRKKASSSGQSD